jgi:hypothetical protein
MFRVSQLNSCYLITVAFDPRAERGPQSATPPFRAAWLAQNLAR